MRIAIVNLHALPHRRSGFTLVELMVVLAILGLLVALALPAYNNNLAKGYRAEARTQLLMAAQFMQRFYTANDSFSVDRAGNAVLGQVPENLKQSPAEGSAIYNLALPSGALNPMAFTLNMGPVAGGKIATDPCGTFTITSTGVKGVLIGGTAGNTTLRDTCWK